MLSSCLVTTGFQNEQVYKTIFLFVFAIFFLTYTKIHIGKYKLRFQTMSLGGLPTQVDKSSSNATTLSMNVGTKENDSLRDCTTIVKSMFTLKV